MPGTTDENEKVYKKFFLQKSVLDSLRVYIELTDDFFLKLSGISIVGQDELDKIKEMQWPLNRNLLLQILVRLPWDKDSFEKFCNVIEETQNDQLNKQIVQKAREVLDSLKEAEAFELMPDGLKERDGDQISQQTKNEIKTRLRDRDETIHALEVENTDLKTKMAVLSANNQDVSDESANLDKCVTDMLTAIKFDLEEAPVEKMLLKVSEIYWANVDKISRLNDDIKSLKNANKELRERVTMFTEENIALKAELTNTKLDFDKLLSSTTETINKLTADIAEEKEKSHQLQISLRSSGMKSARQIEIMEEEMKASKTSISKMKKDIGVANRERDAAKEELKEINDRTRKLLLSLDLLTHCDSTALSVDHARNIGYARRRRGPNAPPLPPPSEETVEIATDLAVRIMPNNQSYHLQQQQTRRRSSVGELPSLSAASPRPDQQPPSSSPFSSPSNGASPPRSSGADPADIRSATPAQSAAPANIKCVTCGKSYLEESNYDGACQCHQPGATLLNQGTSMEVWSCCKSVDTLKGCVKARHSRAVVVNGSA